MKRLMLAALVSLLAACGDDGPQDTTPGCDYDGEPCMSPGNAYVPSRPGTCRAYEGAGFTCCAGGCWDAELQFCQPGNEAPKCGEGGALCSPANCTA